MNVKMALELSLDDRERAFGGGVKVMNSGVSLTPVVEVPTESIAVARAPVPVMEAPPVTEEDDDEAFLAALSNREKLAAYKAQMRELTAMRRNLEQAIRDEDAGQNEGVEESKDDVGGHKEFNFKAGEDGILPVLKHCTEIKASNEANGFAGFRSTVQKNVKTRQMRLNVSNETVGIGGLV